MPMICRGAIILGKPRRAIRSHIPHQPRLTGPAFRIPPMGGKTGMTWPHHTPITQRTEKPHPRPLSLPPVRSSGWRVGGMR